jgi:hypothetical protein
MGKIIKTQSEKIGHVIGVKNNSLLCEELDHDHNFLFEGGKRRVFACSPGSAKQIGYMDINNEILKRFAV